MLRQDFKDIRKFDVSWNMELNCIIFEIDLTRRKFPANRKFTSANF